MLGAVYEASHKNYGYRRIHNPESPKCTKTRRKSIPTIAVQNFSIGTSSQQSSTRSGLQLQPIFALCKIGHICPPTIKDLYDDFIVAPVFDHTNSIALVTHALKRATQKIRSLMGFFSTVTIGCNTLYRHIMSLSVIDNITPSMLRRGNCWDNSLMENIFGYLKEEC